MVITGLLDNVFVVSVSINGVTVAGPDTNSDSLTVTVAAVEVTVVAAGFGPRPNRRLKNDSEQIDNGGDGLPDFIKG